MSLSPEITTLIARIDRELGEIEQETTRGINLIRDLIARFPDNASLNQFFAYFSSILFFTEITRTRRIPSIVARLSGETDIQTVGEELSTLLGQILETKIAVRSLLDRLED